MHLFWVTGFEVFDRLIIKFLLTGILFVLIYLLFSLFVFLFVYVLIIFYFVCSIANNGGYLLQG